MLKGSDCDVVAIPLWGVCNYRNLFKQSGNSLERNILLNKISFHVEEFSGVGGDGQASLRRESLRSHEIWVPPDICYCFWKFYF